MLIILCLRIKLLNNGRKTELLYLFFKLLMNENLCTIVKSGSLFDIQHLQINSVNLTRLRVMGYFNCQYENSCRSVVTEMALKSR